MAVFLFLLALLAGAALSTFFVFAIQDKLLDIANPKMIFDSLAADRKHLLLFLLFTIFTWIGLMYIIFWQRNTISGKIDMVKLTPEITIPKASGQNQYGSARFTTEKEQAKHYTQQTIDGTHPLIEALLKEGEEDYEALSTGEVREVKPLDEKLISSAVYFSGIPISWSRTGTLIEKVQLIHGDVHTLTYGSTRCGKTRTLVIQSLCMQALAGVDMLNIDPKGELYDYLHPTLLRLNYAVFPLDFKDPKKSIHYNFLEFVVQALNEQDISKAIQCCWDFVDCLVVDGQSTEPIWSDGQKALLTAGVMMVVYDNSPMGLPSQYPDASEEEIQELYVTKHKAYQNCNNLYNFISQMAVPNPGSKKLLLEDIILVLPDDHPSKMIMRVAESAPSRMRGSFITSALATLRLFTDPNIAEMTSKTTPGLLDAKSKKAVFLIVPDSRKTYYALVSLFISQYYQHLADCADKRGGRLIRDIELNLEEIGNCPKIVDLDNKLSVGAGRGIHFNLYLQSKEQLVEKYGKEVSAIISDNCHYTMYLKSSTDTAAMIEQKLNKYTVMSTSSSSSLNDNGGLSTMIKSGSTSASTQLVGRSLLTADEICKIARPYLLVLADNGYPSLMQSPDLSNWMFNKMLGLGDEDHNRSLREFRENCRPEHVINQLKLWDFLSYVNMLVKSAANSEMSEQEYMSAIAENFSDNF